MKFERIALELNTGAAICAEMAQQVRPRPDLPGTFVSPASGTERALATIWEEVLRVTPIGAHDGFAELGGKSIHLVRIHGLIRDRLQIDLDLTALFQHSTIKSLAERAQSQPTQTLGRARADNMRAARKQRAARVNQQRHR